MADIKETYDTSILKRQVDHGKFYIVGGAIAGAFISRHFDKRGANTSMFVGALIGGVIGFGISKKFK